MARLTTIAVGALLCFLVRPGTPPARSADDPHPIPVTRLDLSYRYDDGVAQARVRLGTGEAIEYRVEGPALQVTLQMMQAVAAGRGHLLADVDGQKVRAIQLTVP